jgi:hypothetical protein
LKCYNKLSRTNERRWPSSAYLFLDAYSKTCRLLLDENSFLSKVIILPCKMIR